MPFIPHTEEDIRFMLNTIGVSDIQALFDEIPKTIPEAQLLKIPPQLNEQDLLRMMEDRQPKTIKNNCFIGAGAYDHYIPAVTWDLVTRGEFYSAYTPYQAEASQGTLQLIYEYQTMMANLMGMEVSNASLYDGATALAEAALMAIRVKKNRFNKILIPTTVHPHYRQVVKTILSQQSIEVVELPYDKTLGTIDLEYFKLMDTNDCAAVVFPQPNFFGCLEAVDELTKIAHAKNLLVIALVNPMAMAIYKEPGSWGDNGADICCGDGQPLGVPLSGGGPYFGFMCCKKNMIRELPGRIVGRTVDAQNKEGFTLTLQTREQHIRRSKATSNICTNQGLLVTAATIYMSLMGAQGLIEVAQSCYQNTQELFELVAKIPGVQSVFKAPFFHEFVIKVDQPIEPVLSQFRKQGFQAGFNLQKDYPELQNSLLVCVTETKNANDIQHYYSAFNEIIKKNRNYSAFKWERSSLASF